MRLSSEPPKFVLTPDGFAVPRFKVWKMPPPVSGA